MQRYFVDSKNFNDTTVTIYGDDVHHITKVMRNSIDDKIICCDNKGLDVLVSIVAINQEMVECQIISKLSDNREPSVKVTLVQALPKADKMDLIIQKGTEIGVSSFLPFTSERTIVQLNDKKLQKREERWRKIAKEAAEQAHRSKIPDILPLTNLNKLFSLIKNKPTFIAYEKEDTILLSQAIRNINYLDEIFLIIGPEGGFSEKEVEEAVSFGAVSISLGKRILRTETAGLVGVSNLIYHIEEF